MDEPPISLSLHAIDVIAQRDIRLEWIARVISCPSLVRPDTLDPRLVQAFGAIPERDGRVLRVVYNPGLDVIWVVTVFFDRSMRGKL